MNRSNRSPTKSCVLLALLGLSQLPCVTGFAVSSPTTPTFSLSAEAETEVSTSLEEVPLTHRDISNLRFRQLKRELEVRGEDNTEGTTSALRRRLRDIVFPGEECIINPANGEEECGPDLSVSARACFTPADVSFSR